MTLADCAASYVDRNTAVLSAGRTKTTQASLSCCCCALDAVIRSDSRLHRCAPAAAQLTAARLPSLLRLPADYPGRVGDITAAATDTSAGTRLSGYTAIFVFFFSLSPPCPSPPTFTLHSLNDSGSNSLLLRQLLDLITQVAFLKVNILPLSGCQ